MATQVLLPKFGQTVETSEIVQWLVKEGDQISKSQVVCEIATDKSSLEVESQYAGTLLKILLPPGKTAPVGCVMAILGDKGETLSEAYIAECLATQSAPAAPTSGGAEERKSEGATAAPPPAPSAAPAPPLPRSPAPAPSGRLFISPRARALAKTRDVPIQVLRGTGENSRIVEADVEDYLRATAAVTPAARAMACQRGVDLRGVRGSGPGGQIVIADLDRAVAAPAAALSPAQVEPPALTARVEKASPMRRAIAQNMVASWNSIPAFHLEVTVEAEGLIARREAAKAAGQKISYGDIIARATALTVRRHPLFAATWTDAGIQYLDRVHIGFAVAVPGGLVVPVVHDCDRLDIAAIAARSTQLVDKARGGKLSPDDYSGAVFTLSNLGSFPVDRFTAIVPPGQSGIIAVGRIRDEIIVRGGGLFPTKVMSLTLSADHRYVDGAVGAAFMGDLKAILEDAELLA